MCYVWGSFVGCVCVFFCGGRGYSFVKPAYTQQVAITQAAMNSTPRGPGVSPKAVGLGWGPALSYLPLRAPAQQISTNKHQKHSC